jgi:hypothetical protein
MSGHTHETFYDYVMRFSGTNVAKTGSYTCKQLEVAMRMYTDIKLIYFGETTEEPFKLMEHIVG